MANIISRAWKAWKGMTEKRSISSSSSTSSLQSPSPWLRLLLGGSETMSGVQVNAETALGITALWRSIDILASSIAALPFKVYRKEENGNRIDEGKHPVSQLIRLLPEDDYLPYTFWYAMIANAILWGHSAAQIIWDNDGRPVRLKILLGSTEQRMGTNGKLYYQNSTVSGLIAKEDIIFLPGMLNTSGESGRGIIACFKEIFGEGIASQIFSSRFFKNGAAIAGYISHPQTLSDGAMDRLRDSWADKYEGLENVGKTAVLEEGSTFTPLSKTPKDTETNTVRKNVVEEVARITGVPMHKLMAMERATFNNIEVMNQSFVDDTLMPWIVTIQQEVNRKLFYISERGTLYAQFNLKGRLRGDSASRAKFYKDLFYMGAITPNEIRRFEDMNIYEGGDRYFFQANLIPSDKIDEHLDKMNAKNTKDDGATKP
jgi:HK97 family phage portal protein